MKFFKNMMVCLIIFFIVAIVSFCGFYYFSISPISSNKTKVTVDIPYGSSSTDIANILLDKGLIRNEIAFRLYLKLEDVNALTAGTYSFSESMSTEEMVEKISKGEVATSNSTITFKEGKTIKDLSVLIASKTDYSEEEFLTLMDNKEYMQELITNYWFLSTDILNADIFYPLEGYLFPDTYDIYNLSLKEIVKLHLDNTKRILDKYKTKIESSKYNVHDILTLASIIELEGSSDSDRVKIADVFTYRLDVGISLGSCVTADYGHDQKIGQPLTSDILNEVNAYNTRNTSFLGLPIGPICNPGESSIKAALNPADTDYSYFVSDKNGVIYFTKSLTEHNNKIKELKNAGLWLES